MKNRNSLTVIQLNDSHAYFDLHQEMFWQGDQAPIALQEDMPALPQSLSRFGLKGRIMFCLATAVIRYMARILS